MNPQDALSILPAQPPLRVDLGDRGYDIHIGEGLLADAGRLMRPLLRQRRLVVVTDANIGPLYLPTLETSLDDAGIAHAAVVLPAGEQTKSFRHLEGLCERLLALRLERGTVLVALGGGVIGDLAGFAAGILLRGIDFVQIPTTLLAQVDSAVGGKTGINSRSGKNLVGLFHQPRVVIADVDTLDTLDIRQLRAGYAEVVKYGLIGDAPFFAWLETNGPALLAGDAQARIEAVRVSCRAKAAIVAADEREAGVRALLNFGHTFAHALEVETGYGDRLLHGEAVAVGMVLAFDLAVRLGHCDGKDAVRVRRHLESVGLPTDLRFLAATPAERLPERLVEHMQADKKVVDGRLTFILPRRIGDAFIDRSVPVHAVRGVLADALSP
jgi:3-dehydroquinate synthase